MRYKYALFGVLLLSLVLLPALIEADCLVEAPAVRMFAYWDSPQRYRTYPYSTSVHLSIHDGIDDPAHCGDCWYEISWSGDISGHGDSALPFFPYDRVYFDPYEMKDKGFILADFDFDGEYTIYGECWDTFNGVFVPIADCSNRHYWPPDEFPMDCMFYIDREELDSTKPYTALGLIGILLAIAYLIFYIGKSLDAEHAPLKIFYAIAAIVISSLAVWQCVALENEFLKIPSMHAGFSMFVYVFMWGILTVTFVYFMIYLIKTVLSNFKP